MFPKYQAPYSFQYLVFEDIWWFRMLISQNYFVLIWRFSFNQDLSGVFFPPIGFFIPGFPKLQRFQNHHDQILYKLLPKLKKHLVVETIAFPPHSHVYILMSFDLIIRIISHVYVASPVFSFSLTRTRSRCPAAFTALNGSCSVLLTG